MSLGPVQVLVIGTSAQPDGSVLAELDRLAEKGIVRLVDLVVVERTEEGSLDTLPSPPGLHPGLGRIAEEFLAGPAGFSPSDVGLAPAEEDAGASAGVSEDVGAVGAVGVGRGVAAGGRSREAGVGAGSGAETGVVHGSPARTGIEEGAAADDVAGHAGVGVGEGAGDGVEEGPGDGVTEGARAGAAYHAAATTWSLLDAVPMGTTAVIALIEHVWAGPLRTALASAGAAPLGESWLGPADLADLEAIVGQHTRPAPH